jgi:hypothetical protein
MRAGEFCLAALVVLDVSCGAGMSHNERLLTQEEFGQEWPPLPPVRMSISPIIEAGLELCEDE